MAIGAIMAAIPAVISFAQSIISLYPPLSVQVSKWAFSTWPNMVPGIGELASMYYRNEIGEGDFTTGAREQGYNDRWAKAFLKASTRLLDAGNYIALWRRGEIDEGALNDRLHELRFLERDREELKKVSEYFPAVPDLVRFAVREVYTPATVAKFGQMEDIPTKFIEEAGKAGLPEDQANNFWASHWDLPSALQGFRMLHRGIIDEDTLKMLLKSLDVMPFWRDMLIKLSYNPLTRVDVRRMHAMGVLDDDAVLSAYKDTGNSPENAELLLEFTKQYNADESKGMTRSIVQKAFKEDMIDEEKFRGYLSSFGYAEDTVDFWIDITSYEKTLSTIELVKDDLFERYRAGELDLNGVRTALNAFDLPATYVESTIAKEKFLPSRKLKMPTKEDLAGWLKGEIITEDEFKVKMADAGYREEDISLYVAALTKVE